jgi:hypothetical protein
MEKGAWLFMTQNEISKLLEMLVNAYPMAIKNITNPDALVSAWELAFGDDPADVIYKAARHHMNTCKFFPTVADIRQSINKGQLIYGNHPQPSAPAIEAPKAPKKMIKAEDECSQCWMYHDICDGLSNGKCNLEGI